MNIIILTGNEIRHKYFRIFISNNPKINVLSSYCEGNEHSLENRVKKNCWNDQGVLRLIYINNILLY